MSLASGTKLGPYEIVAPLGAGGMGEVYRARDTRLDRSVAVKILPAHLADSPEAGERFEREARTISSLNHPHICQLYDVGLEGGVRYLVMELLEGETLAERLRRGALPVDLTLRWGAEIAEGLAAAHRCGVVHRDLKPGNIMLTKTGAKLMDFGLAKGLPAAKAASAELTATLTSAQATPLTAQGSIVGTFQYMSPEQVEGKEADARSDIFSFGAVLYEMTTGQRAFEGKTMVSVAAAILEREPPPISSLQPMTPPALDRVIRKCLAKDPDQRWQSAGDLASELAWIGSSAVTSSGTYLVQPAVSPQKTEGRQKLAWAAAAVALLAAIALGIILLTSHPVGTLVRTQIAPSEKFHFNFVGDNSGPPVISPDGKLIVLSAKVEGRTQLYLRPLNDITARALPGTDNAIFPFWSPDGRSVGFFADAKLKRIDIAGGPATIICDAVVGRGGAWSPQGVIIFAPHFSSPLMKVSASGGTPVPVTQLQPKYTTHRWPSFMPDGQHFLYLAANHTAPNSPDTAVFFASLDGKENRMLFPSRSNALYASGYLLFVRNSALNAQPFDPATGELQGESAVLNDDLQVDASLWRGTFSVSNEGTMVYQPGTATAGTTLTWIDRSGKSLGRFSQPDSYQQVQLSPDDKKVLLSIGDPLAALWVYDLGRDSKTRLTFGNQNYGDAVWSADGSQIVYTAGSGGLNGTDILMRASNGTGEQKEILRFDPALGLQQAVCDWSHDGRFILFRTGTAGVGTGSDLWVLPMSGDHKPYSYLTAPGDQVHAQFSPDGRWVAYVFSESGRQEIFVAPFPWTGAKWQVSDAGGTLPRWSGDGRELFYYVPGTSRMMAVKVDGARADFEIGEIRLLFEVPNGSPNIANFQYAVTRDGQKFLMITTGETGSLPLTLVQNWTLVVKK